MTLDKAIASGKDKRKQYRGSKAVDASCRNHGSCPACEGKRTHKNKRSVTLHKQFDILPAKEYFL